MVSVRLSGVAERPLAPQPFHFRPSSVVESSPARRTRLCFQPQLAALATRCSDVLIAAVDTRCIIGTAFGTHTTHLACLHDAVDVQDLLKHRVYLAVGLVYTRFTRSDATAPESGLGAGREGDAGSSVIPGIGTLVAVKTSMFLGLETWMPHTFPISIQCTSHDILSSLLCDIPGCVELAWVKAHSYTKRGSSLLLMLDNGVDAHMARTCHSSPGSCLAFRWQPGTIPRTRVTTPIR